jgi:hypothetical protein
MNFMNRTLQNKIKTNDPAYIYNDRKVYKAFDMGFFERCYY